MKMKEKSFVSVVFYIRNSELYVSDFLNKVLPAIDNKFEHYEFICVNNDSSDKSIDIIKQIHNEKYPTTSLNIVTLSYCRSIEEAMSAGIDLAIGDFVYEFKTVLIDYDVTKIYEAYSSVLDGNDVVSVSPNKKIKLAQKIYYLLYNLGVKKEMRIYPEKFKLFSRRSINRVASISKYFSNNTSTLNSCGLEHINIFYSPSSHYIKYDKQEKNERLIKAIESLMIHTYSIQYFLISISFVFFVLGIILLFMHAFILGVGMCVISICSLLTTIISQYINLLINMNFKNKIHLIKNIEKVVK